MALLFETFQSRDSRVNKTIVIIDLKDSTGMKEREPEASWLTTYGWFFDLLYSTIEKHRDKGKIIKHLGDGVLAIFNEDSPSEAINWAIEVQESIVDAQDKRRVSCDCAIGIAYGEVVEFDTSQGTKDYIGMIVDKAFRICSAANAKAIFVDTETVSAAAMNRITSRSGSIAPRRTPAQYQGPEESVTGKGFSIPITYHEILWANTRYGVNSPFVTTLSTSSPPHSAQQVASQPQSTVPSSPTVQFKKGRVVNLSDQYGFIRADSEDFWFNNRSLFRRSLSTPLNSEVWFIPADPLKGAKSRRAIDVVSIGVTLDGKLEHVNPKGFGRVICTNDYGVTRQFFIYLKDSSGWLPGIQIEFEVSENKFGFAGVNPKLKKTI